MLCICLLIGIKMWMLDVPFAYEPLGPRAFPLLLALLMAICAIVLLFGPLQKARKIDPALLQKNLLLFVTLLGYALAFEWLGFPLATGIMAVSLVMLFGGQLLAAIAAGATLGIGGYFFFDRLLQITLPLGRIWG